MNEPLWASEEQKGEERTGNERKIINEGRKTSKGRKCRTCENRKMSDKDNKAQNKCGKNIKKERRGEQI